MSYKVNEPQIIMAIPLLNDFLLQHSKQPREYRTNTCTAPKSQLEDANLLTKECIKSYFSDWNLIHYKYSAYSGSYLDLPS